MSSLKQERSGTKTILLVEDEDAHAAVISRFFEDDSPEWSIHHVTNISDARKWLEQNSTRSEMGVVLVISDFRLPDGVGLELAKDAKIPEEVGFPLIILTGVGSQELAVKTLKSGAMDYVVKGADQLRQLPRIAVHVIREWDLIMERKAAEQELKNFINDLEKSNSNLEEFMEEMSRDLESSLSTIKDFSKILSEKYGDRLDDTALDYLKNVNAATEKASKLIDGMLEYLVPIYFDSSLIGLYNAKMHRKR
jgi:DNA-binding NtrC family response regulator